MRRALVLTALLSLALPLAACGGSDGADVDTGAQSASLKTTTTSGTATTVVMGKPVEKAAVDAAAKGAPECSDMVRVGAVIEAGTPGICIRANGERAIFGSFSCKDGRELWQADTDDGASLWAWGGEQWSADGYSAAYAECAP